MDIQSRDELGELGESFNQMSTDLADSNRKRRQQTADIAHDLRTPLSVVLGYTEALSEGKLEGSQEIFNVVHQEVRHLNHLINDLRTLSLADAGDLPLNLQDISPRSLLERTASAFQEQAGSQGIDLQMQLPENPLMMRVDPERMAQVLGNLVSNALFYTAAGGRITLSAADQGENVLISVSDTGPGIDPADLANVFDRFYRADSSRQHDGGAGLGLSIARSLVELQGGRISVQSQPGQGTCFDIKLPAA